MALTARERAEKALATIDTRIAALEARKKAAVEKVEARYADELAGLNTERTHAAAHPALQPDSGIPAEAFPAQDPADA